MQLLSDCGGETEEKNLRALTSDEEALAKALRYLAGKKWIHTESEFFRKIADKTEKIATLSASAEEAMEYAARRPASAAMQRAVLELMCSVGSAAVKEICYYTGASFATVKRLASLGYLELSERPVLRCRQIRPAQPAEEIVLNQAQQEAFAGLCAQMERSVPIQRAAMR